MIKKAVYYLLFLYVIAMHFSYSIGFRLLSDPGNRSRLPDLNVTPADIILLVLLVTWLIQHVQEGTIFGIRTAPPAVFLLLAAVLLSFINTKYIKLSAKEFIQHAEYILVAFIIFRNTLDDRATLKRLVYCFGGVVCLALLAGLYQYAAPSFTAYRVGGFFENRNQLSVYLALTVPFLVGVALYEKQPWARYALLVTTAGALVVTLSGFAFLALLAGLLVVFGFRKPAYAFLLLAAVAVLLAGGRGILPRDNARILRRSIDVFPRQAGEEDPMFELTGDGQSSNKQSKNFFIVSPRYRRWEANCNIIAAFPVFGAGAGNHNKRIASYYGMITKPSGLETEKHFGRTFDEHDTFSRYMVAAVETGVVGVMALIFLFMTFFRKAALSYVHAGDGFVKGLGLGALGSMAALLVLCFFHDPFIRGIFGPLVFIAACAFIIIDNRKWLARKAHIREF